MTDSDRASWVQLAEEEADGGLEKVRRRERVQQESTEPSFETSRYRLEVECFEKVGLEARSRLEGRLSIS